MSKTKPKMALRRFNQQVASLEEKAEGIASKTPGHSRMLKPITDADEAAPQPVKPSSKKRREKFKGERLSAYIPPNLDTELRVRCAREKRSISDAVTEALEAWLGQDTVGGQ